MRNLSRLLILTVLLAAAASAFAQTGPSIKVTGGYVQASGTPQATTLVLQRGTSASGPWTQIATLTVTASPFSYSYQDVPSATNVLTPGTTYYYIAYDTLGSASSALSPVSNGTLYPLVLSAPSAPAAALQ